MIQSGMTTIRRFWADPPEADDLMRLTFNFFDPDRSVLNITVPAQINGAMGQRPPEEFTALGLRGRPIAATNWVLKIDTDNPTDFDIDFRKLKDIVIMFTYTYGNPPEFAGF